MKGLLEGMFAAKKQADEKLRTEQEYQAHINQLRTEQARHMQQLQSMNMAQQHEKYHAGWNDPRREGEAIRGLVSGIRPPTVEELHDNVRQAIEIIKRMQVTVERTEKKVEQLSGFYHWVTEVHPELAAQHKAMRELYEAANAQPREEMGS